MRLLWRRELPRRRLLCNVPLFDGATHLFTPDLLDVRAGVVGEYDGRAHLVADRRRTDLDRGERYRRHGLELVTMVAGDHGSPDGFWRRLRGAYARAEKRSGRGTVAAGGRGWTVEQPRWWVDTTTVARRRELHDRDRAVWLRHRAA